MAAKVLVELAVWSFVLHMSLLVKNCSQRTVPRGFLPFSHDPVSENELKRMGSRQKEETVLLAKTFEVSTRESSQWLAAFCVNC